MIQRRFPICLLAAVLSACLLLPPSCAKPGGGRISDGFRNYYEIFVRSFYDTTGDGVGDLDGVTEKLPYITEDLGADGIWLMPVMPSPSYHKYDVTDYTAIDPAYGTLEDFDALVAEARERDVMIVIDLVLNHTSNRHPWFTSAVEALAAGQESQYIDYYNFKAENPGAGYSLAAGQYYYECRFVPEMPDLNLDSPGVREEIGKIVRFWLDRGVGGFRLDAVTSYYTGQDSQSIAFLSWLNSTVKAINPDAYLVAEAWTNGGAIAGFYQSGIDSFFNFPYSQQDGELTDTLNARSGTSFASSLAKWNQTIRSGNAGAKDALFLSNHDQARSAGFLGRNLQKQKMAAALYLLAPGNPFIYYGEEIGMNGSGADPNKRLPFLWSKTDKTGIAYSPPGATQTVEGIEGADRQIRDSSSLLRYYQQILAVKARHPGIARGDLQAVDAGNPRVAIMSFTWQGETVYVVHNLADVPITVSLPIDDIRDFRISETLVTDTGKPKLSRSELKLPPMSTVILTPR